MKYDYILPRLYNTPLFLDSSKIDIITANFIIPMIKGEVIEDTPFVKPKENLERKEDKGIAIVDIFGTLVSKNGAGLSGSIGYSDRKREILKLIEQGFTNIGFYIGSHGGEAGGLFAFTNFIKNLPKTHNVGTFGFTDDYATSAAYAILSACQTSYSAPIALSGSIGAVMTLVDVTKADKKANIKYHILRSKEEKALGNPHEVVTQAVLDSFQKHLLKADTLFNKAVLLYRENLSLDTLIATKGNCFMGEESLSLGLIDFMVESLEEVIDMEVSKSKILIQSKQSEVNMTTTEELTSSLAEANAEVIKTKAELVTKVAEATLKETTRCLAILEAGITLKISNDAVKKRISTNTSSDDSLEIFTAIAEGLGNSTKIESSSQEESSLKEGITPTLTDTKLEVLGMKISSSEILNSVKKDK